MWEPKRVTLTITVEVNLDGVPGAFHTKEYAQEAIEDILAHALSNNIPHYKPLVVR
jgi:hypothetical protein